MLRCVQSCADVSKGVLAYLKVSPGVVSDASRLRCQEVPKGVYITCTCLQGNIIIVCKDVLMFLEISCHMFYMLVVM